MVEIGAAEAGASGATAFRVERRPVIGMAGVAQIDRTLAGESLRGAAGAGRQHAIEHVDAAPDRTDQIGGLPAGPPGTGPGPRPRRRGALPPREGGIPVPAAPQPPARWGSE